MINPGNKGEWAEIYIFLKLIADGKVYMADKNMEKLASVYMNILRIFREEEPGIKIEYIVEDPVRVIENGSDTGIRKDIKRFEIYRDKTWNLISTSPRGNGLFDMDIASFLEEIKINKLKAPAQSSSDFFGGTEDITMEVHDYRSGIDSIMGFSCKSQFTASATLFNASGDNTNFKYRITGSINDFIMDEFNNLYNVVNKKNSKTGIVGPTKEVAVDQRISYLKDCKCNLEFVCPVVATARRNLIQSGGIEMPCIVGEMLRYYFYEHNGKVEFENVSKAIRHLAETDPVGYQMDDLEGLYRSKVGHLLYNMFTGMRMASVWSGRASLTGGDICAKKDGDVVAYHANVADEFRDFLVDQLSFETSSCTRHKYMQIYKEGNDYFINLNMQFRFSKSEIVKAEDEVEKLKAQLSKLKKTLNKAEFTLEKKKNAAKPKQEQIEKAENRVNGIRAEYDEKEKEVNLAMAKRDELNICIERR